MKKTIASIAIQVLLIGALSHSHAELFAQSAFSSVSVQVWLNSYSFDDGRTVSGFGPDAMYIASDGNFLLAGGNTIFELGTQGNVVWQKAYDCLCSIKAIAETPTGFVIAATQDLFSESSIVVLRVNVSGGLIWSKSYHQKRFDSALEIIRTRDGGYLLAGFSADLPSKRDGNAWLLKLGGSGAIQWQKTYNVAAPTSVNQLNGGDFLIGTDLFSVLRLTSGGNVKWQSKYSDSHCCVSGLMNPTNDGGFVVTGNRVDGGSVSGVFVKANASGSTIFSKIYKNQRFVAARPTADGGTILLTTRLSSPNPSRISIMKLDSSGSLSWRKLSLVEELSSPRNVSQTPDGGFLVTSFDRWILKLDSTGSIPGFCRNILANQSTTSSNIQLSNDKHFPTVTTTHATAHLEQFGVISLTPVVEPFCPQ